MICMNQYRPAGADLVDIARSASPYALLQQALERQRPILSARIGPPVRYGLRAV